MSLPSCSYRTGGLKPGTTPNSPCCQGNQLLRNAAGARCNGCGREYHVVKPADKSGVRRQYRA